MTKARAHNKKPVVKEIPAPPVPAVKVLRPIGHTNLTKFTVDIRRSKDEPLALFTLATVNRATAVKKAQERVRKEHNLPSSVTLLVKVI